MHIQLNNKATEIMLRLAGITGKSANELVNTLIQSMDSIELNEVIDFTIKRDCQKTAKQIIRRVSRWQIKI